MSEKLEGKRCITCMEFGRDDPYRPIRFFLEDKNSHDGYQDFCLECRRDWANEESLEKRNRLFDLIQAGMFTKLPVAPHKGGKELSTYNVYTAEFCDKILGYFPGGPEAFFRKSAEHLDECLTEKVGTNIANNALSIIAKMVAAAEATRVKEASVTSMTEEELREMMAEAYRTKYVEIEPMKGLNGPV